MMYVNRETYMSAASEKFRVLGLDAVTWPCTFRYHVKAAWGETQQVLTVDAPGLYDMIGASVQLGLELWQRGVALATTRSTSLLWWETVAWKASSIPVPQIATTAFGLLSGTPAPRFVTPQLELLTGHADDLGFRRFPLAGAPAEWQSLGILTHGGMNAAELAGRILMLGLGTHMSGSPMQWLLTYPQLLPADVENPSGVAFRVVTNLRVCTFPDRAPEPSTEPWP